MSSVDSDTGASGSRHSGFAFIPHMLHQACENGNLEKVKEMLSSEKYGINDRDQEGQTPLHIACKHGWLNLIRYFIENNASANIVDDEGQTPLHKAVNNSYNPLAVRALVESRNVQIDRRDQNGHTALHLAIIRGIGIIVEILMKANADPTVADRQDQNALHIAVMHRHRDSAMLLFEHDTLNRYCIMAAQKSSIGKTPIHIAASSGFPYFVMYFLDPERGVNPFITDKEGNTVLHEACSHNRFCCIEKILALDREKVAKLLTLENNDGNTALHISSSNGDTWVSETLIHHGSPLHIKNRNGHRPLTLAIKGYHDRTCKAIINALVQNRTEEDGVDYLFDEFMLAVFYGMVDIVPLFIQHVDINSSGSCGNTALHSAARNGREGMVEILIDHGACPYIPNNYNELPLAVAEVSNHTNVVDVINAVEDCHCGRQNCPGSRQRVITTDTESV